MIQRTLCAGIRPLESPYDRSCACFQFLEAFAFRHQIILFVSTSRFSSPTPPCAQTPAGPTAAVLLPSTPVPAARATQPTAARPRDTQPSSCCFPRRITSGRQTECKLPAILPTAAATIVAGLRWDNKLRKRAEASPERCASLPRLA